MKQTIFFFFGLNLIADLEAVVNSSWFWHQPSFYAQQFFLSCYGFCIEKDLSGQTASIHSFLEFLASLGKADRAGGSGALCSPDLHWGVGAGRICCLSC